MGKSRFSEFQKSNPKLSSNVLSDRIKDLIKKGIIEKTFDDQLKIKYQLTPRGKGLNRVLFELAVFACNCGVEDGKLSDSCSVNAMEYLREIFLIEK